MAEMVFSINNFDNEVIESDIPVLVDFWASWCGPCKMIAPDIHELAQQYEGRVKVGKVNVDEQPDLASRYNVMSIPTLLFFKNGQLVNTSVGVRPKNQLEAMLDNLL